MFEVYDDILAVVIFNVNFLSTKWMTRSERLSYRYAHKQKYPSIKKFPYKKFHEFANILKPSVVQLR